MRKKRSFTLAVGAALVAATFTPLAQAEPIFGTDLDPEIGCDDQCQNAAQTRVIDGVEYQLVWNDEFDGDTLDPAKWDYSQRPENGRFCYANKVTGDKATSNIYVDNGALTIQALPITEGNPECDRTHPVDAYSGSITTQGLASWKYGRFETRLRIASGAGMWPALWMMPDYSPYGWPLDGELDWIETIGLHNTDKEGVMHSAVQVAKNLKERRPIHAQPKLRKPYDLGADFHTYEMEWNPDEIAFFYDGEYYGKVSNWQAKWPQPDGSIHYDALPSPFDREFFFKLNLAVNGWGKVPKHKVGWDQNKFQVDYVRVYQNAQQRAAADHHWIKFDTLSAAHAPEQLATSQGEIITELPTPQREGYLFGGWYTDKKLTTPVELPITVEGDQVLFARWDGDKRPITFETGGVGDPIEPADAIEGHEFTLPVPSGTDRYFAGWYADPEYRTRVTSPLMVDENTPTTLYAKWGAALQEMQAGALVRAAGDNRFATAANLSAATYRDQVDTVYLVNGLDYPDALVAGALAGQNGQPLLLTSHDRLPAETAAEIRRLQPQSVAAVGGSAVVSNDVLAQAANVAGGAKQERVFGANRFATAKAVADSAGHTGGTVYLAAGMDFPDALAASSAAGAAGGVVLLTLSDEIPEPTRQALAELKPSELIVVGGYSAIEPEVLGEASRIAGVRGTRTFGANRFQTAQAVADEAFAPGVNAIYLASGMDFPDALAAASVAGTRRAPVLLTVPNQLPAIIKTGITHFEPKAGVVVGGPAVVSDQVKAIAAAAAKLLDR